MMKSQIPRPTHTWSRRDLIFLLPLIFANAIAGFSFLSETPEAPVKWFIGSLTFITAPIIFFAFGKFFSEWYEKSAGWRQSLFEISAFALFVGSNFAIFILLSWLWRGLVALNYGALWTTGSVVLSDIAAIIAIYQALRRRKKRRDTQ